MMKFLKRKVVNYLSNFFLRIEPKYYDNNNSLGIKIGSNSFLENPKTLNGGEYIEIKDNSSIGHSSWLGAFDKYYNQFFKPKIIISSNVRIGNYACITAIDEVLIKDGCLLSEYVYISDHYHGFDPTLNLPPKDQPLFSKGKVVIGENSFIGYRVTILSGVKLGKNCVVGAHSVVTKSFPDYSMIAGSPARLIMTFDFESKQWKDENNKK